MHVLFIEYRYDKPYILDDLKDQALGGTEATVLRVLSRLIEHCDITFAQSHRISTEQDDNGLRYVPLDSVWRKEIPSPDVIVTIRTISLLRRLCRLYPQAQNLIWLHNFRRKEMLLYKRRLHRCQTSLVCVSKYHRFHTDRQINQGILSRLGAVFLGISSIPLFHIYNPIDGNLKPSNTDIDNNKLVCFSAPHKGLPEILDRFKAIRTAIPELQLYLSTPVYGADLLRSIIEDPKTDSTNIILLGALPQSEILKHVRNALCVFYPQTHFKESFGLVFAEANALGTPVLAHDIGAAREVLCESNPLVDCTQDQQIVDTLMRWRSGQRPQVGVRSAFRLTNVADQWLRLLNARLQKTGD
jgi:glycosyltransferase involved in cell wall biosynthesis